MQNKSIRTIARTLIGWLFVGLCASPGYGGDPQPTAPIGQAVTAFGFDVVRGVGRPAENLLVSPYSLATALAMVQSGAKGKTLEQMTQVLHLTGIPGSVDHRFGALQQQIVGTGENRASSGALRVANGLWAQAGYPFLPAFQQTAKEAYRLDDIMRKAKIEDVVVSLPNFTFRSRFRLADTLRALGMPDAFSREADFSGMTAGKELKLAEVYHQTYVAVAEQGTEAAAATAASMMLAMARQNPDLPKPVLFIADHPFLVFIRHDASGAMLFQGRVTDPRS